MRAGCTLARRPLYRHFNGFVRRIYGRSFRDQATRDPRQVGSSLRRTTAAIFGLWAGATGPLRGYPKWGGGKVSFTKGRSADRCTNYGTAARPRVFFEERGTSPDSNYNQDGPDGGNAPRPTAQLNHARSARGIALSHAVDMTEPGNPTRLLEGRCPYSQTPVESE